MENQEKDPASNLPTFSTQKEEPSSRCSETAVQCEKTEECNTDGEATRPLPTILFRDHHGELSRLNSYFNSMPDLIEKDMEYGCLSHFYGLSLKTSVTTIVPKILGLEDCPSEQKDQRQQLFLKECKERERYGAALCSAVMTRKLQSVEHLLPLLKHETIRSVLVYCTQTFGSLTFGSQSGSEDSPLVWQSILEVLTQHPEWGSSSLGQQAVQSFMEQPKILYLHCFSLMIKRNATTNLINMITHVLLRALFREHCKPTVDQLIDMVEKNCDRLGPMLQWWLEATTQLLRLERINLHTITDNAPLKHDLEKIIATGLSTRHRQRERKRKCPSRLVLAAVSGRVDLVKLWYRSGAVNQGQLLRLKKKMPEGEEMKNWDPVTSPAVIETSWYIHTAATNPRRLQDQCALAISDWLGHRSAKDRAAKAQTLTLPNPLINKILFKDIIADFLKVEKDSD